MIKTHIARIDFESESEVDEFNDWLYSFKSQKRKPSMKKKAIKIFIWAICIFTIVCLALMLICNQIVVNNANYTLNNGAWDVNVFITAESNVGSTLDGIDHIGTLQIYNKERKDFSYTGRSFDVIIPKNVTKHIDEIEFSKKPSDKCLKALREQFPDTKINEDED